MNNSARENKITVSIIMPVYNRKTYVGNAIESVLNQTFSNYELIVIDDGSTDGSSEIIDHYAQLSDRIKVVHAKNGGPSKARNIGLKVADAEWIQFMDSDDTIENNMLEQMFKNSEDMDVITSGTYQDYIALNRIDERNLPSATLLGKNQIADFLKKMDLNIKSLLLNYLWNKWIRKSVIYENNILFDEALKLGEDFVYLCRIVACSNNIRTIDKAYYHYCYHGQDCLKRRFDPNEFERTRIMSNSFEQLFREYGILREMQHFLTMTEGRDYLNSIYKINLDDCELSESQKIAYIQKFYNNEDKKIMMYYLDNTKGIKSLLKRIALKLNSPRVMYYLSVLGQRLK